MTTIFRILFEPLVMVAVCFVVVMPTALAQQEPRVSSPLECLPEEIIRNLLQIGSLELNYTAETKYSERYKQLDPLVTSEKSTHVYKQQMKTWSYDVTKTYNSGRVARFLYHSDGDVYQEQRAHTGMLLISKSDSVKNIARWFNPLFEGLSFAMESQYYVPGREAKYSQATAFSPLFCDLVESAKGKLSDSRYRIEPASMSDQSRVHEVRTYEPDAGDKTLSKYNIKFNSATELLPAKVEKRDSAGGLIATIESSDYKTYNGLGLPGNVRIVRFLDGAVDSETVVKVSKVFVNSPEIKVQTIDPSTASSIYDQINDITIHPGMFK